MIEYKLLRLVTIHTKKNLVNIFTKVVTQKKLKLYKEITRMDDK